MPAEERAELASITMELRQWFLDRQMDVVLNPPKGVQFSEEFNEWLMRGEVRSFESDLFRRLAIGYAMMKDDDWKGGILQIEMDDMLDKLLEDTLRMRRNVMDEDTLLIKSTF